MSACQTWIERLTLTDFRNHCGTTIEAGARPVVLLGANGAGKTNILEAVSLIAPGQGLRRANYSDLARQSGRGTWAVSARLHAHGDTVSIGTGLTGEENSGRTVRIDGTAQKGSGALADFVEMVWLTPALDGLFTGARRRQAALSRPPGPLSRSGA